MVLIFFHMGFYVIYEREDSSISDSRCKQYAEGIIPVDCCSNILSTNEHLMQL